MKAGEVGWAPAETHLPENLSDKPLDVIIRPGAGDGFSERLDNPMIWGRLSQHLKTHYAQRHIAQPRTSPNIAARLAVYPMECSAA